MSSKTARAEALKSVMRNLPYPVTIVTAAVGKEKRGITIGSFTSLSLEPPLVSFNVERTAQMHLLLEKATHFTVHIPEAGQSDLCDHFAVPARTGTEQFETIDHYRSSYGTPVLSGTAAVIHCRMHNRFEAGDHTIIAGEVLEVKNFEDNPGILYYNRAYHSIGRDTTQQ